MIKHIYSIYSRRHHHHRPQRLSLPHDNIGYKGVSIVLTFFALISMALPANAEIVDELLAVVNGDVITLSMVQDAMNAFWNDIENRPRSKDEALQKLIDHALKLQEARKFVIVGAISEKDLAREVARLRSLFPSQKDFDEALKRRGITQTDLEEYLMEEIMVNEMVNRKFRNFVTATDLDASEYFQLHKEEMIIPETVYFDQIFFPLNPDSDEGAKNTLKNNAQRVFDEINNGADLLKYIGDEQEKGYVALKVGYITVSQVPIPVVASVISQLEVGESRLIETPAGYFVIRLNDRRPPRQANFDEAKEEIKSRIIQQKTQAELEAWIKKQRETADIRIKTGISIH